MNVVEIHERFLAIAQKISVELVAAIAQTGPIELTAELTAAQDMPFADRLCQAISGQQLSVKAARSIWTRVLASVPEDLLLIEHFAAVDPAVLRECGLSGAKTKAVRAIAWAALLGQLDAQQLSALSAADRTEKLTALWGVGQWTADMMNIFYFGEPDIWPDGDVAARKTLERLTSKRRKIARTAALFAPYRSHLALYMWRYVDAKPG